MKNANFAKAIASFGIAAVCAGGLSACGASDGSSGVAATVNGTEIAEAEVTSQIENMRAQIVSSMRQSDETISEDDAWGQYLVAIGETPESLREQVVDSLVTAELVTNGAADKGVTVDESEVDSYVEDMSSQYGSDEEWLEILSAAGFTEESYRDTIRASLIDQGLLEAFGESSDADEATVLETAQSYVTYYDGAKRSSHILFRVEDISDEEALAEARAEAEEVLARINNGEISFEDAAREYSDDTSAENGGDVGWDRLNSFVTEYTDALDELELDEVSEPVQSDYGIHIIKCTEVFTAPEEVTSMDQVPEAFRETIEQAASSTAVSTAYQDWIEELKANAEIVINPMPANVPYNIDLTPYQTSDDTSEDVVAADDTSEDIAAADDTSEDVEFDDTSEDVEFDTSDEIDSDDESVADTLEEAA